MENSTVANLLPDLAPELALEDTASDSSNSDFISGSGNLTAPTDSFAGIPIGADFLPWLLKSTTEFLDLADLDRIKTAEALRGTKEDKIRDKINMANSTLVLLANYGSNADNEMLVKVCEAYAVKMQNIIKRLCL